VNFGGDDIVANMGINGHVEAGEISREARTPIWENGRKPMPKGVT